MSQLLDLIARLRTKVGFEDLQYLPSKVKLLEISFNQVTVLLNAAHVRTGALLNHSDKEIQVLPFKHSFPKSSKKYYGKLCDMFGNDDRTFPNCSSETETLIPLNERWARFRARFRTCLFSQYLKLDLY